MVLGKKQIGFLCTILLLFESNRLLANEQYSLQLLVPMQNEKPCSQCSNLPHASSRYVVPSKCLTDSYDRSFSVRRRHVVPTRPQANRIKSGYTQSPSLSLGYKAASAYIVPSPQSKRYAPPSDTSGGAAGKALADWLETNGGSAWLYTNDGVKYYDMNALEQLFNDMGGVDDMPGLTWEEFLQWFNNGNQTQYKAPVSDGMAVMFLFLLGYILCGLHGKRLSHHNQNV